MQHCFYLGEQLWKINRLGVVVHTADLERTLFVARQSVGREGEDGHVLKAIKGQLAILQWQPAHYNIAKAWCEFLFIDKEFLPMSQRTDGKECIYSQQVSYYTC